MRAVPIRGGLTILIRLDHQLVTFDAWAPTSPWLGTDIALHVVFVDRRNTRPDLVPQTVFAAAFDGTSGYLIGRTGIASFLAVHQAASFILHDGARTLAALAQLTPEIDLYNLIEERRFHDTSILDRLHALATAGDPGHCAPSLVDSVERQLGCSAAQALRGEERDVPHRLAWALNRPVMSIAASTLRWAAMATALTWRLNDSLVTAIVQRPVRMRLARGFVDDGWLDSAVTRFGLLTHHIQLKASIVLEAMNRRGIIIDVAKVAETRRLLDSSNPPWPNDAAIRAILDRLHTSPLHPQFQILAGTGRTRCRGVPLQGLPLPTEGESGAIARSLRRCFRARPGHSLLHADYRQIELVAWAVVLADQFRLGTSMKELINAGADVHRLLAAELLAKDLAQVTSAERNRVKPASFGLPVGMRPHGLQTMAAQQYGVTLSLSDVDRLSAAYRRICPELHDWLEPPPAPFQDAVFTLSGRLRAVVSGTQWRNTTFQGLAADGAIEALWRLWRAGYAIVNFVHDEIVVEMPVSATADMHRHIEDLMRSGMASVLPGIRIDIESTRSASFDKNHIRQRPRLVRR